MSAPRGRGRLLLLAGLFIAPLLLATWLYHSAGWRPRGTVAQGELIQPPRSLPRLALAQARGGQTDPAFLHQLWSLVYIGEGSCASACREALAGMRQVRLALDKDASRVQRVFLYEGDCCDPAWLDTEQPGLLAASLDSAAGARLRASFSSAAALAGQVFIVDPAGNLMMAYPAGTPARSMLKDLERLLRLSKIG